MYAVKNRSIEAIILLLNDEARIQDDEGNTALMIAV